MSPEIPLSPDVNANELVIVPASLEFITTDGVVSFDGVLTTVCSLSVGAAVSIVKLAVVADGPAFPTVSVYDVANVNTLLSSSIPAVGV